MQLEFNLDVLLKAIQEPSGTELSDLLKNDTYLEHITQGYNYVLRSAITGKHSQAISLLLKLHDVKKAMVSSPAALCYTIADYLSADKNTQSLLLQQKEFKDAILSFFPRLAAALNNPTLRSNEIKILRALIDIKKQTLNNFSGFQLFAPWVIPTIEESPSFWNNYYGFFYTLATSLSKVTGCSIPTIIEDEFGNEKPHTL